MRTEQSYMGYLLIGDFSPARGHYEEYWVEVHDPAHLSAGTQFTERTRVTYSTVVSSHGNLSDDSVKQARHDLEERTFARARARLALGEWGKGQEYSELIASWTREPGTAEPDDDHIQQQLLKALANIRRRCPDHKDVVLDVRGFCLLMGIELKQYVYNADLLKEEGCITENLTAFGRTLEAGYVSITSSGIRRLGSRKQQSEVSGEAEHAQDGGCNAGREFDVVISYAGEDRECAKEIAQALQRRNVKVYYDEFDRANMWGKD